MNNEPQRTQKSILHSLLRVAPNSAQAEQALLGALLANNKAYERVAEFLLPRHFADPLHGRIYAAIAAKIDANGVADPVTLRGAFENDLDMDELGGAGYLAKLLSAMVGIVNAGDYGRAILDAWFRRELIGAAENLHNACFGAADETGKVATGAELLEQMEAHLSRIAEGAGDVAPVTPAGEAVAQAVEITKIAGDRASGIAGITTGYKALDRMLSGLQKKKLVLLGARPSMGKTGLALGIAVRAAASGVPTLFWSGEMGPEQLGARMAAAHAKINTVSVFNGRHYDPHPDADHRLAQKLSGQEWERLVRSERAARRLPLYFDDRPGLTVQALRARARRMKRTHKLGLLVVDYAGLMRSPYQDKLYERMTEISQGLKATMMELDIAGLVCAQLSRQNEGRENKMPQLQDLRDSGALEQDADVVMFIHRDHYYLSRAGEPTQTEKEDAAKFQDRLDTWHRLMEASKGLARISIAKNRQGPTGMTRLRFVEETTWFYDESEGENAPAWGDDLLGGE